MTYIPEPDKYKKIEERVYTEMNLTATKDIFYGGFLIMRKSENAILEYLNATPKKENKCSQGRGILKGEFDIEYKLFGFHGKFYDLSLFEELKDIKF